MQEALTAQLQASDEYFTRGTRCFDESDSTFTPVEGLYTVAQHVAHAAQTIEWFFDGVFRPEGFSMDFEKLDRDVRAVTSLAEARAWMERAVAAAKETIAAHDDADWSVPLPEGPIMGGQPRHVILPALTDHTAHHRGALTVYARLRGKTPAMPYMDM